MDLEEIGINAGNWVGIIGVRTWIFGRSEREIWVNLVTQVTETVTAPRKKTRDAFVYLFM